MEKFWILSIDIVPGATEFKNGYVNISHSERVPKKGTKILLLAASPDKKLLESIYAAVGETKLMDTFRLCPGRRLEIDPPNILAVSDDHRWVIGTLGEFA